MVYSSVMLLVSFVASLSFLAGTSFGQTKTNLEFLSELTDDLLRPIAEEITRDPKHAIVIRRLGESTEKSLFFENRLIGAFRAGDSRTIYMQGKSPEDPTSVEPGILLEYEIVDLSISYALVGERIGLSDQLKRVARVSVLLNVVRYPSGRVMWNEHLTESRTDVVSRSEVADLESADLLLTKGNSFKAGAANDILQPVLLSGVTGAIVLLFYKLRTR